MTLTTSSNNSVKEWKETYFWSLKKNRGMMALLLLLQFMAMPLVLIIWLSSRKNFGPTVNDLNHYFISLLNTVVPFLVTPLTLIFVVVIAVSLFNYMHQKRSVDLFHALPVGRVPMLLGRYCAGLTTLFVPMMLNFAIYLIIGVCYGVDLSMNWKIVIGDLLWLMLMSTATLTFSIFMAVCTGTTFDMVISIVGVNVAYPLLVLSGSMFASALLPGLIISPKIDSLVLSAFAPFVAAFMPYSGNSSYISLDPTAASGPSGGFLAWWIIFTLILLTGSILLYKKRKSECAESSFAFPLPKIVIRFMVTAVSGLGIGLILQSSTQEPANFFVGLVAGSLAAHIVVEAVYSRGFKQLKKSFLYYGVFAAVFIVAYAVLATGAFGYDTRVPNAGDVESISIDAPSFKYDGSDTIYGANNREIAKITPTLQEKENIEKIVALHKKYVADKKEKTFPYCVDKVNSANFTLTYKLKNGSTMKRSYSVYYTETNANTPTVNDNDMINSITSLKEYCETGSILFYIDPEQIKSIDINTKSSSGLTLAPSLSTKAELLEALKQDYLDGNINYDKSNSDDLYLYIEYKNPVDLKEGKLKTLIGNYSGEVHLNGSNFMLPDNSGRTRELIKKLGWDK